MKYLDSETGYDLFAPQYRKEYEHLDSFDWEATRSILWPLIDQACQSAAGKPSALLDAGCGDGRILTRVQKKLAKDAQAAALWGWDISAGMLKQAATRLTGPAQLRQHDVLEAPGKQDYPAHKFNLVWAFFLLVHIPHPQDFFEYLHGVMQAGAVLVLNNVPQKDGYVVKQGAREFTIIHEHHRDEAIHEALLGAGFNNIDKRKTDWSCIFSAHAG